MKKVKLKKIRLLVSIHESQNDKTLLSQFKHWTNRRSNLNHLSQLPKFNHCRFQYHHLLFTQPLSKKVTGVLFFAAQLFNLRVIDPSADNESALRKYINDVMQQGIIN